MPPLAAEGSDVLLLAHNVTENPLGYAWHRGERVENTQLIASYRVATNLTTKGPAHSGRETLYPNGTLLIQSVTQKDTGSYTLLLTKDDLGTERQTGHLHVLRECFLLDLVLLGEGVSSVLTDPDGASIPSTLCPVSGFEHSVQGTHCGGKLQRSEMLSRRPGPDEGPGREGLSDEGLSRGRALSVQPPGPLPVTMTLRKTLQDSGKTLA